MSGRLDYFGVHPGCGCVTAWMASGYGTTDKEVREFYVKMAASGREVRRMPLNDETRAALGAAMDGCSHGADPKRDSE